MGVIRTVFRLWAPLYDLEAPQRLLFQRVHAAALDALDSMGGPAPGRVLDLGCGTGLLLPRLARRWPGARLVGADLSPSMLARARPRARATGAALARIDSHALPFEAAAFDVIASTLSYHWWTRPEIALAEIRRVLRPGGRLVLATPAVPLPGGVSVLGIVRWPAARDVRAALAAAGFPGAEERALFPIVRLHAARRPADG